MSKDYKQELKKLWQEKFQETYEEISNKKIDKDELEKLSEKWLKYTIEYKQGATQKNEHLKESYEIAVALFLAHTVRDFSGEIWVKFQQILLDSLPVIFMIIKGVM